MQQAFAGDTLSLDVWDWPVHKLTLETPVRARLKSPNPVSHALDSLAPDVYPGASAQWLDHRSDRFTTMRYIWPRVKTTCKGYHRARYGVPGDE